MTLRKLVVAACLALALAVVPAALAATAPSGTYKTTIKSKSKDLNGAWAITFAKHAYTVKFKGKTVDKGKFTTKSGTITFKDSSGADKCPAKGTYKYKISGKKLTFTNVNDKTKACAGRATVLKGKFTKV